MAQFCLFYEHDEQQFLRTRRISKFPYLSVVMIQTPTVSGAYVGIEPIFDPGYLVMAPEMFKAVKTLSFHAVYKIRLSN